MSSLTVYANDFSPYIPAVDARRVQKAALINGENFFDDVDGPRAAYMSNYANFFQFTEAQRKNTHSFLCHGLRIYGTPTGLWMIDPISFLPTLLLEVSTIVPFWPWSMAEIGDDHFFCQYRIGLFKFRRDTLSFELVATPDVVKSVCSAYGRLVCLGDVSVFWSSLDDGTDFDPSLTTGAGAQALVILSANAFRVDEVSDGVIVTTDKGWIKGEFVQANYIFRWYILSRAPRVFTPNGGVSVPDLGIIQIDPTGMHVSDGTKPKPWEPAMAAYFQSTFFKTMDRRKWGCVRLSYSESLSAIFVSFAANTREGEYHIAFVFSLKTSRWGVFNHPHYAIIDTDIPPLLQNQSGYMDTAGYMRYFTEFNYTQAVPSDGNALEDVTYRVSSEPAMTRQLNGAYQGSTEIFTGDDDPAIFAAVASTGLWNVDDDNLAQRYITTHAAPNAFLELGPFRYPEQKEADETSDISSILIGVSQATSQDETLEDWGDGDVADTTLPGEDWGDAALEVATIEGEDWGFALRSPDSFRLELIATDDGVNEQIQGPELVTATEAQGSQYQYSAQGWSGIFHRITISAFEVGQNFQVKYVDIAGHLTGRHI